MVTKSWASTTSAFDRSTWWPVDHVCSAKADAATCPLVFRQSVFQGPPRLTNVHFGAIRAGDLIDH